MLVAMEVAKATMERVNELGTERSGHFGQPMSLTLMIWLCCLPVVFVLVAPFFGWKVAGTGALALLGLLLVICFGICTTKVYKKGGERHA